MKQIGVEVSVIAVNGINHRAFSKVLWHDEQNQVGQSNGERSRDNCQ